MAGVYIHIPFCRRACHYCDFHFTTNLQNTEAITKAILSEIELRKEYLNGETVETIYFGGGTPSLLPTHELEQILGAIDKTHAIGNTPEITLEANPEDLSSEKLGELRSIGINRLSLGTQSFIDTELSWMNRMHSAKQAINSIENAKIIGFNNISIDLIFGLPDQTIADWEFNLETAHSLEIQHISSYGLTVEKKTVLNHRINSGIQKAPDEVLASRFLEMNMEFFPSNGFEHYEVSNFARSGFISKHNSAYWQGTSYLGIGPSAHSFNGNSRQWNVRSNAAYMKKIEAQESFFEKETLSVTDRINEHILTGLRTKWGVQKKVLDQIKKGAWNEVLGLATAVDSKYLNVSESAITLTSSGIMLADKLTAELFV
jgi:oxygen-independent coproporphyrinogen-3 oxidase